jgi:hypothetical protein
MIKNTIKILGAGAVGTPCGNGSHEAACPHWFGESISDVESVERDLKVWKVLPNPDRKEDRKTLQAALNLPPYAAKRAAIAFVADCYLAPRKVRECPYQPTVM